MEQFLNIETLIIELLLIASLVAIAIRRLKVPYTVALVIVGLLITFPLALGFSGIELNHDVDSAALADSVLHAKVCSSVHEPCPRDVPAARMVALDWQVSSEDEARRRQAVRMVKRSIHLASELGAAQVVVHPGNIPGDGGLEKELRRLFQTGQTGTPEYAQLRDRMIEVRHLRSGPRLEAVHRSLSELLACAREEGILLGLENRYHYLDIPTPAEMGELLACAGPDTLGMVYDVGPAQAMSTPSSGTDPT